MEATTVVSADVASAGQADVVPPSTAAESTAGPTDSATGTSTAASPEGTATPADPDAVAPPARNKAARTRGKAATRRKTAQTGPAGTPAAAGAGSRTAAPDADAATDASQAADAAPPEPDNASSAKTGDDPPPVASPEEAAAPEVLTPESTGETSGSTTTKPRSGTTEDAEPSGMRDAGSQPSVPLARPAPGSSPADIAPVSPIPGVPSRPAWRPMEVGSPAAKRGVTVFGTRLTYPQAAIGAGVLFLVLLLVVVLATQAFDRDGDPTATEPTVAATTAPGPTQASSQPSAAGSSAPSSRPSSSAAPGSAAPPAGGEVALPAGWSVYRDPSGFSVPLPAGTQKTRSGSELYIRWNNRLLLIDQSGDPKPDALADYQEHFAGAGDAGDGAVLRKVRLVRVDGYFKDAADWEFLYTTDGGNRQHAVKRNMVVNDHQAYSVSWYTTPEDWDAAKADLQVIYQGFRPKQ